MNPASPILERPEPDFDTLVGVLSGRREAMGLGVTHVGSTRTVEFCEQYKERISK